jgi:hypothetical protein
MGVELMYSEAKPWIGLIGAPLLFLSNMQASLMLGPWVCGNGHFWLIHLAHVTTLVLIAVTGVPAWNSLRHTSGGQQFVALLSVTMTAFTGVALLAHWLPNFVLGACE